MCDFSRFRSVREDKLWKDVIGKEIRYYTDYGTANDRDHHYLEFGMTRRLKTKEERAALCALQLKLFKMYLRNDHTLLFVFQRSAGTNLNVRQRLGLFYMYLCAIMVAQVSLKCF